MLYQIDDLRMAVETAKRLLTKEQIDKTSGQATASPFMKTSQENSRSKSKNEKKVSFSAVEAMERITDSIERLASLMDTKLDRRDDQYRPRIYQGRNRGRGYRQNNYRSRNRSYSRDHYQNNYRGRGNYSHNRSNRNYRSNYRDSSRSRERNNYIDGYRYNTRSNYRRDNSDQRYRNRSVSQDHGRSRERYRISSRESSQSRGGNQYNRDQSRNEDRRQGRNNTRDRENRPRSESRSRSSSHVSTNRDRCRCYRCNEYDHFARECPDMVTDGRSDETGDSLLQMLDPDEILALNYAEGGDFDMDLNM